jgi:hypothetical protein
VVRLELEGDVLELAAGAGVGAVGGLAELLAENLQQVVEAGVVRGGVRDRTRAATGVGGTPVTCGFARSSGRPRKSSCD